MAIARTKKRMESLTHGVENGRHILKDTVDKWSSIPNASVGKGIEKSVRQAIKDGGVKGVKNKVDTKNKYVGKEVTTKRGNKSVIKDLILVNNNVKKNLKRNKKK